MALAKKIASTTGYPGYVVGGPAEKPIAQNLTTDPSLRLTDWTGSGAVSRYWKIFRHAQWTVSNDSGLAHVAALCGSAVHVVWGGGNPKRTEPMGPGKVQISFNPIDCWPCERNLCMQSPSQKLACLSGISAEEIWKEIYVGIKNRDRTLQ
jgi:heptosyltransferase-2